MVSDAIPTILKAFGEGTRLRILRLISAQELSVKELVDTLGLAQPRVSRHLAVLRRAGLAEVRRESNRVYYRLAEGQARAEAFAGAVWQAIRAHQADEDFFPADLQRLRTVVARRAEQTRAYFDQVATEWDRIKRQHIHDALPFMVVANLVRPHSVAADVGAGTGEMLPELAGLVAKVIGVDSSERMLEACRARVDAQALGNVELRLGDAEDLPLADGECDTVFARMMLHHLADPPGGVREMARAVRQGGKLVLIDLVRHDHDWAREIMADVWLGFTEQQVRRWLAAAGLADVTYSPSAIPSPMKQARSRSPGKLQAFVAVGTKPHTPAAPDGPHDGQRP